MANYCFVSSGSVHCVPVNSFTTTSQEPEPPLSPNFVLKFKMKNLLYSLNNPSLSDLETDLENPKENGSDHTSHQILSIIENYSTHAIYLPHYKVDLSENLASDYAQIKSFLSKVFPTGWQNPDNIQIKQVTGGITNMLLSCYNSSQDSTALMRVYGQGTNLIIDRHREFVSHLVLNSLQLAPPVHARFSNGLVYGFLPGRSLQPAELRNENLYPLIAQQLGNWHQKISSSDIESGVETIRNARKKPKKSRKKFIVNIWELIEDWVNIVPAVDAVIESFKNADENVNQENVREVIHAELKWLRQTLEKVNSPVVTCHCDLLSGNIIVPESLMNSTLSALPKVEDNPIQFIDYEYMLPAPRAFDIANHLAEWQGFDCDRNAIPTPSPENPVLVKWCQGYLNSTSGVEDLIYEVSCYYGMPGFYWGIWAMIQNEISTIDFSYADYGKLRLQEYWDWKKEFKAR